MCSARLSKWILERCNVDWPLEVGHELGTYEVLLRRVCVVRLDERYSRKRIVENSMKLSFKLLPEAGNDCQEGHLGYAAQDEDPKCCKDTLIPGDARSL